MTKISLIKFNRCEFLLFISIRIMHSFNVAQLTSEISSWKRKWIWLKLDSNKRNIVSVSPLFLLPFMLRHIERIFSNFSTKNMKKSICTSMVFIVVCFIMVIIIRIFRQIRCSGVHIINESNLLAYDYYYYCIHRPFGQFMGCVKIMYSILFALSSINLLLCRLCYDLGRLNFCDNNVFYANISICEICWFWYKKQQFIHQRYQFVNWFQVKHTSTKDEGTTIDLWLFGLFSLNFIRTVVWIELCN